MFHNKNNYINEFDYEQDIEEISEIISAVQPPKSISPEEISERLKNRGSKKFILNNRSIAIAAMLAVSVAFGSFASAYLYGGKKIPVFLKGSSISQTSENSGESNSENSAENNSENTSDVDSAGSSAGTDQGSSSASGNNSTTVSTPSLTTVVKAGSDYSLLYDAFDAMKNKSGYTKTESRALYDSSAMQSTPVSEVAAAANSTTGKTYTTTNIQVQDVDEADIVKTDGDYIYTLSSYISGTSASAYNKSYELKIVGCNNGDMVLESSTAIIESASGSGAVEMFLSGNKIAVIIQEYDSERQQTTSVAVYDISDKTAPAKQNTITQNGQYLSSRLVANRLTVITNQYVNIYNTERKDYNTLLPTVTNTLQGVNNAVLLPNDIYIPKDTDDMQTPNYVVFTNCILDSGESETNAVLGCGNTVYATTDKIYIAGSGYTYTDGIYKNETTVSRFLIKGIKTEASGGLVTEGYLINQFAMDEYNGYFRIATTSNSGNNLVVFNGALDKTSSIEGMANGETIKAVRFMGKTAYLVTFLQTDPLFVIDLSDQTSPVLKGELKIPGFSSYLHPVDSSTLLGIGYAENSSNVKLSLFNVSDMENPKEITSYIIGGNDGYSYSEATSNHKAVTYDSEKHLLSIPVQLYNYNNGTNSSFNGFELFNISSDSITEIAKITCNGTDGSGKYYSSEAVNPQRSVIINNFLYAVSPLQMVSMNLETNNYAGELWMQSSFSMEQMFLNIGCNIISNSSAVISPAPYAFSSSIKNSNGYYNSDVYYD